MKHAFGKELQRIRLDKGLRIKECVTPKGYSPDHFKNIELGFRGPPDSREKVLKLVEKLNLGVFGEDTMVCLAREFHLEKVEEAFQ